VKKQKRRSAWEWEKAIDEVFAACLHIRRLVLELEEALARKGPAVRPERLVQIQKLLLLEKDVLTNKTLLLADLAECAAEAQRVRGRSLRKRRGTAGQGVKRSAN
jgi:hypothetical protein